MHWFISEIQRQKKLTIDDPTRFVRIFFELISQPGRFRRYQSFIRVRRKVGDSWQKDETRGTRHRAYKDYADYLEQQASKLQHIDLRDYDVWFRECLAKRLCSISQVRPGLSVLCLAARIGTEVKAFQDIGCFAVGIDLNPGANNKFVLPGDFHDIQFPANSVDIVYTNSMDHVFDASKMLAEIKRVLKPNGIFILEAPHGEDADQPPGDYESFWWKSIADLEQLVNSCGFIQVSKQPIERPAIGANLIFEIAREAVSHKAQVKSES